MVLESPYTNWEGDEVHGRRPVLTGVWVRLDDLFPLDPNVPQRVIETGLDLSGHVSGVLHGRFPSVNGQWLGVVNYSIAYADGRRSKLRVTNQLVPFNALRQRR